MPRAVKWAIITATLIAVGLRLYELSRPGYLLGITSYDDGTDFGSAVRLVHGALPYRDFIMVQPPGITLLMAPVAAATKAAGTAAGMATGRVLTALASAASVPLIGLLARHRGLVAVIVSCGLLAVFPDSLIAAETVLLEPWLVLFCLLGALAVFDGDRLAGPGRQFLGGLAFGFAGAVKVWAILPVAVIIALTIRRPRQAGAYVAGVAAGFAAPVLPFAWNAPGTFYRSVVIAQLIRSDISRAPFAYRLQHMLGMNHLWALRTPALIIIGLAVIVITAVIVVLAWRLTDTPPPPLDWFAMVTALLVVAAFMWPADFYDHYAGFLAPFLALALALPVSRLTAALAPGEARQRGAIRLRRSVTTTAALVIVGLAIFQGIAESRLASSFTGTEINAAKRIIRPNACVVTDQVSYTIMVNRFVSSDPACSPMVDGVGSDYALSNGRNGLTGAARTPAVQALWWSAFHGAQYVWLTGDADRRIPWTPQLRAYLNEDFRLLTHGPAWIYVRTTR
jgi:Glycosyltransferase family 87